MTIIVQDTFTGTAGTDLVAAHTGEVGANWSYSPGYETDGVYELDGTGGVKMTEDLTGGHVIIYPSATVPADTAFYIEIVLTPHTPSEGVNYYLSLYETPNGSNPEDGFVASFNSGGTGGLWLDTLTTGLDLGSDLPFDSQATVRFEFDGAGALTVKVDGTTVHTDTYPATPSGYIAWGIQGSDPVNPPTYFTLHELEIGDSSAPPPPAPAPAPAAALPEIQMPADIQFLRQPYETHPVDLYADIPTQTGAWRKRRVYTSAPNLIRVECFLSPEQAAAFDTWFEQVLLAGQEKFTARIQKIGVGMEWRAVNFYTESPGDPPYRAEALHHGWWRVSALLRTSGEAGTAAPVLTTMEVEFAIPLESSASPTITSDLEVEAAIALESAYSITMDVEMEVPLDAAYEEGEFRITEFDEVRQTESDVFRSTEG